jgi:hypothetical protein
MSAWLPIVAFAFQGILMTIDELHFHRRRGLPRWERIGHPLDTLSVLACYAVALGFSPEAKAIRLYAGLAILSCLFITKDELVHAKLCEPAEQWLHALLFVIHPIVLASAAWLWIHGGPRTSLVGLVAITLSFGIYQLVYWNRPWKQPSLER